MRINKQMQKHREEINKIDSSIIKLLEKRFKIVKKIGVYKKKNKLPIQDLKREKEIIEKKKKESRLSGKFIWEIFSLIFLESKRLQRRSK